MGDVRGIVTISILAALGTAVIFNAGKVQPLVREFRLGWVQILNSVSGANRSGV